jgi:hypothetical protein
LFFYFFLTARIFLAWYGSGMKKNKHFSRRSFILLASVGVAAIGYPANVWALQISEVMYDPDGTDAGREWVEVWNDGAAPVDLASVFLFEADVRHKISGVTPGAPTSLAAGERAIVADKPDLFLADYPNVSPVFDSAFSLSNSGERIALVSATGDEYSYAEWGTGSGATGGKSWQRAGDGWVAATATPGAANADREVAPSAPASVEPSAISAHSGTGGLTTVRREPDLAVDAGRDRVVPVGAEIGIDPEVDGASRASFTWVWGDGHTSRGKRGKHVYRYPGTYAVVLNARGAGGAVATSRTTVSAVPAEIAILAEAGEEGETRLVIRSASRYELNLGGFGVEAGDSDFTLPPDTILLPGGEITLDGAAFGLNLGAGGSAALRRPDGRAVRQAAG